MTEITTSSVHAFFWVLVMAVILFHGRRRLLSYVCLVHLGTFSQSQNPTNEIGVEMAVKAFALPMLLFLSEGKWHLLSGLWRKAAILWFALTCYAAITICWSPFKMPGIKMIAYLLSNAFLGLYFLRKWQDGTIGREVVLISLWAGLCSAVVQSYALQNVYGTEMGAEFAPRFTSFASPQSFALFLLIHIGLLFIVSKKDTVFWLSLVAAVAAILMTGSRYAFLALCPLLILSLSTFKGKADYGITLSQFVNSRSALAILALLILVSVGRSIPENRLHELIGSSDPAEASYEDVVNVIVRFSIYSNAWERMKRFSPATVLSGVGTSSAADVKMDVLTGFDDQNVDANRAMHNEFLRALYEWGGIGLALLSVVCLLATWSCLRVAWVFRQDAFGPCIGLMLGIWLSLLIENFLSDPGGPGGTAIAIFLGFVAARDRALGRRFLKALAAPLPCSP